VKTAGVLLAVSLIIALTGCGLFKREAPADAIAVVGEVWITHQDVVADLEARGFDATDDREIAHFVNQWIDTQLLLHEARNHDLDRDPELARRLKDLETELLINSLLDSNTVVEPPNSQAVIDYWKDHTGEYTRIANEVTLVIAHVQTKNEAWRLREAFDQSSPASQMREEMGMTQIDTLRNLSIDRLPPVISTGIEPLRSGHSSLPIEYQGEWLIVKLLERFREGRPRSIEEVEPLVRARMIAEQRSRLKMEYIEALRREARQSGLVRIRFADEELGVVPVSDTTRADSLASGEPSQTIEE
jgi:hypothetical protein